MKILIPLINGQLMHLISSLDFPIREVILHLPNSTRSTFISSQQSKNINKALELTSFLLLSWADMSPTPKLLESLFFLRNGDAYIILSDLHSIINIPAPSKTSDVIRIFHASLRDFLLDKSRLDKFYIDAGNAHANLTRYFLKHFPLSTSKEVESFAKAFIKHCPLSSPTPELLDDLYEFDFYNFLTTFNQLRKILRDTSYVFDWLKEHSHKNPSGKNPYSHHLHSLDEYLKSELVPFMAYSNRAQLMLTAVMLPQFLRHCVTILRFLAIDLDKDSYNKFVKACRRAIFPFDWSARQEHMARYHILLSEFLGDPTRSKEFHIDGDKFASLATTLANYLFGPSVLEGYPDPDSALQISPDSSRQFTQQEFLLCAFSCLPDCLLKAFPSKSLAAFLQSHEIPPNYDLPHGCSSEAISTAIKAYIMRYDV